jgi:hypothetical protein
MAIIPHGDYCSYLLRFWRDNETAPWRATLQDPVSGERYGFACMDDLYAFLNEQTENQPAVIPGKDGAPGDGD